MEFPISLQSTGTIAVLTVIVGLFWWLHQRRPRDLATGSKIPELGFGYEWVVTPLAKARKDMLERFPELDSALGDGPREDVHLVRFGLFNMTEKIVESHQITRPVEILFSDRTKIESALFGESLKTERRTTAEPVVDGNRVILPKEAMNPRSTLIYNLILRGEAGPLGVSGETAEHGPVKRVG